MGIWKDFCRALEEREVIAFLGDRTSVLDSYALFEITDEQVQKAKEHRPRRLDTDEATLPPFPFPRICLLSSESVLAVSEPELDCATTEVSFKILLYWVPGNLGKPTLIEAIVHLNGADLDAEGNLVYRVDEMVEIQREKGMTWMPMWRAEDEGIERSESFLRNYERMKSDPKASPDTIQKVQDAMTQLDKVVKESNELREKYAVAIRDAVRTIVATVVQCISWINQPDLYVVRVEPPPTDSKKKRKPQEKKIRRYSEREHFILLDKTQLTETWHRTHQGGSHASPLPHLRRGHYKTLRAEKWKENRGKIIWVRATHVGGEVVEWRVGNTVYRVV